MSQRLDTSGDNGHEGKQCLRQRRNRICNYLIDCRARFGLPAAQGKQPFLPVAAAPRIEDEHDKTGFGQRSCHFLRWRVIRPVAFGGIEASLFGLQRVAIFQIRS